MSKLIKFARAPRIAVVRMAGVIHDEKGVKHINLKNVRSTLDKAFKQRRLHGVALEINSPGGSPVQCDLIRSYIQEMKAKKKVPVTAFIEDMGLSGGYYLACSADEIFCSNSSIVGSIGAVRASLGLDKFAKRHGVELRVTAAGKNKWLGDPLNAETAEQKARIVRLLAAMHSDFINIVKESRGEKLTKNAEKENIFEGEIWTGAEAMKLGLVDGIKNIHQWTAQLEKQLDKEVLVRRIKPKFGMEHMLGTVGAAAAAEFTSSLSSSPAGTENLFLYNNLSFLEKLEKMN